MGAGFGFQLGLVLRWHFFEVDGVDDFAKEFGVALELIEVLNLEQIRLSFDLFFVAVALDAVGLEDVQDIATKPRKNSETENEGEPL